MGSELNDVVKQRVLAVWPVERWCQVNSIVAVSGGPDSVALINVLANIRTQHLSKQAETSDCDHFSGQLIVAHVNHGLRGKHSDADAQFVKELADRLGLRCEIYHCEPTTAAESSGPASHVSESDLREFRYECLHRVAAKHAARYIVTGHTRDDQIETLLFRIFRGTGIRGLQGIPAFRQLRDSLTLVRPMLSVTRHETRTLLQEVGCDFRTDASNEDSVYSRNFLRNELLPLVRQRFPDVDAAINRLSQHAAAHQDEVSTLADHAASAVSVLSDVEIAIDCDRLIDLSPTAICDLLINTWDQVSWSRGNINSATWRQLAELITSRAPSKKVLNLPGDVRAEKHESQLRLTHKFKHQKPE